MPDKDKPKKCNSHMEMQFADSNTTFTAKLYFAKEFDEMRSKFLNIPNQTDVDRKPTVDDARKSFARSLSQSIRWEARGGKSGSKFNKTCDDKFILKEMNKNDVLEFEKFAPNYFEYINMCLMGKQPTLLAKIYGVYKVIIKKKELVS